MLRTQSPNRAGSLFCRLAATGRGAAIAEDGGAPEEAWWGLCAHEYQASFLRVTKALKNSSKLPAGFPHAQALRPTAREADRGPIRATT